MGQLTNVEHVAAPPVSKEDFVYVTIPEKDVLDWPYPTIQLNRQKFEPGNTYKCPVEVGEEVERRMKMYNKETVRLLQPKADIKALQTVQGKVTGAGALFSAENGIPIEKNEKVIEVKW